MEIYNLAIAAWLILSVPFSMIVGLFIAGGNHD